MPKLSFFSYFHSIVVRKEIFVSLSFDVSKLDCKYESKVFVDLALTNPYILVHPAIIGTANINNIKLYLDQGNLSHYDIDLLLIVSFFFI